MRNRFISAVIMLVLFLIFTVVIGIAVLLLTKMIPFLKALWITLAVIVWLGVGVEFLKDFRYTIMWR